MEYNDSVTFLTGLSYAPDRLYVAASPDDDEPYSPYTVWYSYFAGEEEDPWMHFVTRWWAVAVTKYAPPDGGDWALVGMSNEGHLDFNYGDGRDHSEKIDGAGVFSEGAYGYGYMTALRQIGSHLYACGDGGQVYRREGKNDWRLISQSLLQAPDVEERLFLSAICGTSKDSIYVAGAIGKPGYPPKLLHWDGAAWAEVALPESAERITALLAENGSRIWACGSNGTLLLGDAAGGFKNLSKIEDNQLFYSLAIFNGKVFLSSNLGLFEYDPTQPSAGIQPVLTHLEPELLGSHTVTANEAELWSIHQKDIVRFDGKVWTRITHPDNAPI